MRGQLNNSPCHDEDPFGAESFPDLDRAPYWGPSERDEYQSRRLRILVDYLWQESPFYRRRMERTGVRPSSVQGVEDLHALPILSKDEVRANRSDIIIPEEVHKTKVTGGTTGQPLEWGFTESWADLFWQCLWRGFGWAGFSRDMKVVSFYSRVIGEVGRESLVIRDAFDRRRVEDDLARVFEFRPDAAYCYAGSAYLVARHLLATDRRLPLKTALTTSEPLLPEHVPVIEEAFECRVYDNYGCNDGGTWGAQCAAREGFHHDFERNILEFVDGHVVATDLWNTAFPFVRYDNGDRGEWLAGEPCVCGRSSPRFRLLGRDSDVIVTPYRLLYPSNVSGPLNYEGIDDVRVVQRTESEVEILLVRNDRFSDEEFAGLREELEGLLEGMQVSWTDVDRIPPSMSGKHRVSVNLTGRSSRER